MPRPLRLREITAKIVEAQRDDAGYGGDLSRFLRSRLPDIGIDPDDSSRARAIEHFVRGYIMTAPKVLAAASDAGERYGMGERMDEVLAWAEAYWFDESDVIPDHLGLHGLLDDAYCSLRLLERLSDEAVAARQRPIVDDDLASANWLAYRLIGEPDNEALEHHVSAALGDVGLLGNLARLAEHGGGDARVLPVERPALGEGAPDEVPSWAEEALGDVRELRDEVEDVIDVPGDLSRGAGPSRRR